MDIDSAGNIIKEKNDVNSTTWYLELSGLYFTWVGIKNYYFVWLDANWNTSSNPITLNIKKPDIEIIDMKKHWSGDKIPVTINAEISHDVDEAYVQFLRNRHGIWEILTWTMGWVKIDKYRLQPQQTSITGGYYDMWDDIWLYLASWSLAAKINPKNWKISIENWFEDIITIELDYFSRIPIIKVLDDKRATMFSINLSSEELVSLDTNLDIIDIKEMNTEILIMVRLFGMMMRFYYMWVKMTNIYRRINLLRLCIWWKYSKCSLFI